MSVHLCSTHGAPGSRHGGPACCMLGGLQDCCIPSSPASYGGRVEGQPTRHSSPALGLSDSGPSTPHSQPHLHLQVLSPALPIPLFVPWSQRHPVTPALLGGGKLRPQVGKPRARPVRRHGWALPSFPANCCPSETGMAFLLQTPWGHVEPGLWAAELTCILSLSWVQELSHGLPQLPGGAHQLPRLEQGSHP